MAIENVYAGAVCLFAVSNVSVIATVTVDKPSCCLVYNISLYFQSPCSKVYLITYQIRVDAVIS